MKNINKLLCSIIALWAILAIIFGFFDLEISKYITKYNNAQFFEFGHNYGNEMDKALFFVGITIILGSIFNDIKWQKRIGFIMILYSIINLQYMLIILDGYYESGELFASYMLLIFLLLFVSLTYNKNWRNYLPIAISFIMLYMFSSIIVESMKSTWGRARFNDLSSDSEFTPWYIINGPNSTNRSFPSGHTSRAFTFLPLLILTNSRKISKKTKSMLIFTVIGFGLYVALARIFGGFHYASDVLFSAVICSILTVGIYIIFQKLKFNSIFVNPTIHNYFLEIQYFAILNQWLGYFYNNNGRKIYLWFDSYEQALQYNKRIKSTFL